MEQPGQVAFSYSRANDYRIVPANGVVGGITTQGDFQLLFYVEARQLPDEVRQEVQKDGTLGKQVELPMEHPLRVLRELQCGVLISREQAAALAKLIGQQLATFDETSSSEKRTDAGSSRT